MKSVLFLVPRLCVGGSELKAITLANQLASHGYHTAFAFFNKTNNLTKRLENIVEIYSPKQKLRLDINACTRYRKYVFSRHFYCVISMGLYAGLLHKLCMIGASERPKEIVCLNMSIPTIKVKRRLIFYYLFMKGTFTIFGSDLQRKKWAEEYGYIPLRTKVIYNGVESNYFNPDFYKKQALRNSFNLKKDDIVLGVVAALRQEKAIKDLIAAAAYLKKKFSIKILVVGDGRERLNLQEESIRYHIGNDTIFLGDLMDVRPALGAMDIFVLPSVAVETFSNAVLEAMAMGLPVVLSDIGGAREMVKEGVNGYIYPPGNIHELAKTIEKILKNNKFFTMGQNSREIVREKFTLQKMVKCYKRLIEEV